MNKQIEKLLDKQKRLISQISQYLPIMIRGSLVKISRRCHNKQCSCYAGDTKHGFLYSISLQGDKATQMVYLPSHIARSKQLSSALRSFKRFTKLYKQLAFLNLTLYKEQSKKRR